MKIGRKTIKNLYLITTHDEYEFPLFVADSIKELSEMSGVKPQTIAQSIAQGRKGYYRVNVENED